MAEDKFNRKSVEVDKNSQLLEFLNAPDETLKKWCGISLEKIQREEPVLKRVDKQLNFVFHKGDDTCPRSSVGRARHS